MAMQYVVATDEAVSDGAECKVERAEKVRNEEDLQFAIPFE